MLTAFYDLINDPERYRVTWRDGELYVEPVAVEACTTRRASGETSHDGIQRSNEGTHTGLQDPAIDLPSRAA